MHAHKLWLMHISSYEISTISNHSVANIFMKEKAMQTANKTSSMWLQYIVIPSHFGLMKLWRVQLVSTAHSTRTYRYHPQHITSEFSWEEVNKYETVGQFIKWTNLWYHRCCRSWMTPLVSSISVECLPDSFHQESNEAQTNLHKGRAAPITTISIPYIKGTIKKIRWCLFKWIIFMLQSGVEWPWDASSCKLDHNNPCKTTEYHATVVIRSTLETGRPLITRLKKHQKHCK